jgi:hypothetical protein
MIEHVSKFLNKWSMRDTISVIIIKKKALILGIPSNVKLELSITLEVNSTISSEIYIS